VTHYVITTEDWDKVMVTLAYLAIIAGVGVVLLTRDLWHWLDRIRWHRRRRARLARRRAKAVPRA
jgi:uncharacterized protein (DUF2062 family)